MVALAFELVMLMPIAPATLILLPPLPPVLSDVSADGEDAPFVPFLVESFSLALLFAKPSSLLALLSTPASEPLPPEPLSPSSPATLD